MFVTPEQQLDLGRLMGHPEEDLPPLSVLEPWYALRRERIDALSTTLRAADSVEFLDMGNSVLTPSPEAEWILDNLQFRVRIAGQIRVIRFDTMCLVDERWRIFDGPVLE